MKNKYCPTHDIDFYSGCEGCDASRKRVLAELVDISPTERHHLRSFIKWLGTTHFMQKYMGASPEAILLHHGEHANDIVDTYIEWVKLGEPE